MEETHTVLSIGREFLHNEWEKIIWEALLESLPYVSLASMDHMLIHRMTNHGMTIIILD